MERTIPFVICTALILVAGMTMASDSFALLDSSTRELQATYERNDEIWKTSIAPLSTALLPIERRHLEVSMTNDGRTSIADFSKWDVIVQYFDNQSNYHVEWLPYVEGPPDLNEWSVKGIYLNADNATSELLEAGILNPDEEIVVEIKLSPAVHESDYNLAIISTPGGVSTWNHFRSYPLYLHNNPTPPTANTTAQDTLPMSTTAPTATTLYNYDTNYSSDPGRSIAQSNGRADETNLARYQTWRAGPLTEPVGDTLEFDTVNGMAPAITHVIGDVYAIAYEGPGSDGFLKTMEIAPSGNITDAVIDTLEFDTGTGQEPSIIHVSGNVYAIAYRGTGSNGFLTTVEIATSGNITDAVIDTLEFDSANGQGPTIAHVSGNIFAIAYQGDGDHGMLKTAEILPSGNITAPVIDTLEFDTNKGQVPDITHVSGNIFAIAYQGDKDDGTLKTVEIDSSGQITAAVIDTLEFDSANGEEPSITHVSGDVYAIAYRGQWDDGFLKTVEIVASGQITATVIDTLEFDTTDGMMPDMIQANGVIYAIAYQGPGNDGLLQSVMILSDGTIGNVCRINGDVTLTLWGAIEDFEQSERGVVIAYLRDYDGSGYSEIASASVDAPDWQSGEESWVEAVITFTGVSYTMQPGHYLDVKVLVDRDSGRDMWFAYDTTDYPSRLEFP